MTRLVLIRHGDTDTAGRVLTGRAGGIHLNEYGRKQADSLHRRLQGISLDAVWASPLERAQETALPLARSQGLAVQTVTELHEVNYGDWQGCSMEQIASNEYWTRYNTYRSLYPVPGGESLAQVQLRMMQAMHNAAAEHPAGCVALVSHGDPIRALLAQLLGIALDLAVRLEISPASISAVDWHGEAPKVLCLNCTSNLFQHC